ncbi:MAG TPA: DHHA1 domain-containing protein [Terriglobales bacterium]|nr:DHHA1 domain-containing protein [Terriglobales bacterium]
MTERLYYTDPLLLEFEAQVAAVTSDPDGRTAITLDRSAFYPTSGGQIFDTGWLEVPAGGGAARLRISEVAENEQTGEVLHLIENAHPALPAGTVVRGTIDADRRRDHMQQHSGQHVLSAAFERLYDFATVSFHMGDNSCTIDLASDSVSPKQLQAAERLANEVIAEDRQVEICFATPDEARSKGVRKIPPAERQKLRLIDIRDFDLNACGGTHVHSTGQIGSILLRKTEKVKQGTRVEFVCGLRAVGTARRDFETLTDAAAVFSTHIWEVPQQVRKSLDEIKSAQKAQHKLLEEVAELQANELLRSASETAGHKMVVKYFADRDISFIKMLAQKLTKAGQAVALLSCGGAQPSLVFAQTPGLANDMGALMKQTVQALGTRGGGNRDMAQGGAPDGQRAESAIMEAASAMAQ